MKNAKDHNDDDTTCILFFLYWRLHKLIAMLNQAQEINENLQKKLLHSVSKEILLKEVVEVSKYLQKRNFLAVPDTQWDCESADPEEKELIEKLGFVFLAYKAKYWYWELVEMLRK